jgi:hypothetical protein
LIVAAIDLQCPLRADTGLGLSQLGLMCPIIPHSPNMTGAVPGERGYGHNSLTGCPGWSLFHWAICVLYNARPAWVFG